jgi:hypothetical protein
VFSSACRVGGGGGGVGVRQAFSCVYIFTVYSSEFYLYIQLWYILKAIFCNNELNFSFSELISNN